MSCDHRSPLNVPLTIEIDEEKMAVIPMTPSDDSSEPMSSPGFFSSHPIDDCTAKMIEETVASAVASEKAKLRILSTFLEKWVNQNNNNLYPTRLEKEQLAKKMNMTYVQVNRWFANRRRKVIKKTKVAPSPACTTPAEMTDGRLAHSVAADQLSTFLHALSAQPGQATPSVKTEEMVMQNTETPLTPPADDQTTFSQVVPEMSQYATEALALQKILAALPQLQTYNQAAALALLGVTPIQLYQAQLQLAQQTLIQTQLQAQLIQQQQMQQQSMWYHSGSISVSPNHISDSEISEMSELSPPPMTSHYVPRPHSPFKDPDGIADKDMLCLMSLSKLSEREQQAVDILIQMSVTD